MPLDVSNYPSVVDARGRAASLVGETPVPAAIRNAWPAAAQQAFRYRYQRRSADVYFGFSVPSLTERAPLLLTSLCMRRSGNIITVAWAESTTVYAKQQWNTQAPTIVPDPQQITNAEWSSYQPGSMNVQGMVLLGAVGLGGLLVLLGILRR